jgi:hypothetical protein
MMAVLDKEEFLTADLFHIRWWKHFTYYFATDEAETLAANVHRSLVQLQNLTYEKSFDSQGVYKGCYVGSNSFISTPQSIDTISKAAIIMQGMRQYIREVGPIIKNDNRFLKYLPGNTSLDVHDEINEHGFGLNQIQSLFAQ